MKLLTLNTHSWLEIHQLQKIKILADYIVAEGIDVVALQEVNQNLISPQVEPDARFIPLDSVSLKDSNFGNLLMKFLDDAGTDYSWTWADSHEGWGIYDEGVALLSRLPVKSAHNIVTSRETYTYKDVFRRCAVALEVETERGTAWFASAHMNWWLMEGEYLFEHDFASLNQQLRSLAGDSPAFLMGDFNNDAMIDGEGYSQMMSLNWTDAFHAAKHTEGEFTIHKNISGWENATREMRIDYVLASLPLTFETYRVVFPDNTDQAISDHSGVFVEFDETQLSS